MTVIKGMTVICWTSISFKCLFFLHSYLFLSMYLFYSFFPLSLLLFSHPTSITVCLLSFAWSLCLTLSLALFLSVTLSLNMIISPVSLYLSIYLSVCLSVCLSVPNLSRFCALLCEHKVDNPLMIVLHNMDLCNGSQKPYPSDSHTLINNNPSIISLHAPLSF